MHEWALAEAVIEAVRKIAKEKGLREVNEIKIKVGELQQIDREILDFALAQLSSPIMKQTRFRISTEKAKFKCKVCGNQWKFGADNTDADIVEAIHFVPEIAHTYLRCPKCHSPDFEIRTGRGVWLASVRGVK
ncbi:MAG: hydrogenase nickel incorporation protein HypA [Candidatus Bathyarchaeota archaeon]|nr:hydrogenase nickel incorporation protein HypA [Candidatus Bathyarchaeota archaeon]